MSAFDHFDDEAYRRAPIRNLKMGTGGRAAVHDVQDALQVFA